MAEAEIAYAKRGEKKEENERAYEALLSSARTMKKEEATMKQIAYSSRRLVRTVYRCTQNVTHINGTSDTSS